MSIFLSRSVRQLCAAVTLILGGAGSAMAGVYTGTWDPQFGAALPNLSWSGKAAFYVPDACSNQADGVYAVASVACSGTTLSYANVNFFDTSTPAVIQTIDFAAFAIGNVTSQVKVVNHYVVAVTTSVLLAGNPSGTPAALGNLFALQFSLTSPQLVCLFCGPTGPNFTNPNVIAQVNGMEQIIFSYNDNGTPKLVDKDGNAVGLVLDSTGGFKNYTAQPVPEPGTWAMMAAGLALLGVAARRRRA